MSFIVEFITTGAEFLDFADGDAAAEVLRDVAGKVAGGNPSGTITGKDGNPIGTWGFERSGAEEVAELRHRINLALEYLMSMASGHETVHKAADILRGES